MSTGFVVRKVVSVNDCSSSHRSERICLLEQQLAIEVEQRKKAEALNEQLHRQMVEQQRLLAATVSQAKEAAAQNTGDKMHGLLLE